MKESLILLKHELCADWNDIIPYAHEHVNKLKDYKVKTMKINYNDKMFIMGEDTHK